MMTCFCPTHCATSQDASDRRFPAPFRALIQPPDAETGCWLWTGPIHSSGAGRYRWKVEHGGTGRYIFVHRLSYFLDNGVWPSSMRNLCGQKLCCKASHWWTKPDSKWTPKRKAVRGRVKQLSDDEIRNIRLLVSLGSDEESVGAQYGLTRRQVAQISLGRIRPEAGGPIRASRHLGIRHYATEFAREIESLSMRPEPVIPTAHSSLAVSMGTGSGVISNGERPFPSASYGRDTRRRRW